MSTRFLRRSWLRGLFLLCIAAALAYGLWATTRFVLAFNETKTVHIFPTTVHAIGWSNENAALRQDLSDQASAGSFTKENAAYIVIEGVAPQGGAIAPAESAAASSTTLLQGTVDASSTVASTSPREGQASEGASSTPLGLPAADVPYIASSTNIDQSIDASSTLPTTSTSGPQSYRGSVFDTLAANLRALAHTLGAHMIDTAYAAATSSTLGLASSTLPTDPTSTPAVVLPPNASSSPRSVSADTSTDTPTCTLVDDECHTIAFSGFAVSGSLTQKTLRGVELNMSLAGLAPDTVANGGKLEVRYYHAGKWKAAGEVFVSREVSNHTNVGYITARLDGITQWSDLSDVQVVLEYVRADTSANVSVFVDAVWIDAMYTESTQDILSGVAGQPTTDLPANVTESLGTNGADASLLVQADGTRITFPYLDTVTEDSLMVRLDRARYQPPRDGAAQDVYVSVTNTGSKADAFYLYASFPNNQGTLRSIARYTRNIPEATTSVARTNVTYFCEGAWQTASSSDAASSSTLYTCGESGESLSCATLSDSGTNCLVKDDALAASSTAYTDGWLDVPLAVQPLADTAVSDALPSGYAIAASAGGSIPILPGQTVYLKVSLETPKSDVQRFVLSASGESYFGDADSQELRLEADLRADAASAQDKKNNIDTQLSSRNNFTARELPEFKFQYNSQHNILIQSLRRLFGIAASPKVNEVVLVHKSGKRFIMPADITYGADGQWDVKFKGKPDPFIPGEYTLLVHIEEDGQVYEDTHTFEWGVLAINTVQSVYTPGDSVAIQMAALSPSGDTICDATLTLNVVDPSGFTQEVPVVSSGLCDGNNVVSEPDYAAQYTAKDAGEYQMILSRFDESGQAVAEVADSFDVRTADSLPVVVARTGPTRINPTAAYSMDITLFAHAAFTGTVHEQIPADFAINESDGSVGAGGITWSVSMGAGDTKTLHYVFDAPDKSPVLYTLGPLSLTATGGQDIFDEPRAWQIASDATGNMILLWDGTNIPTGWSCISCSAGQDFFQRFARGAPSYGTTGGAATHTFTGTGAVNGETDSGTTENFSGSAIADTGHSHTFTPTFAAESNLPAYRQLKVIESTSAGEPASIPTGAIALFMAAVPAGYTRYSAQDNDYIYGENTVGTTGGANTHAHTITGTLGAASGSTYGSRGPAAGTAATAAHTHTVSTTTASVDTQPPFLTVILGKLNATSSPVNDMVTMWSGDAPLGWILESDSSGDFYQRFPKATSSYGTTGGNASSTPADITGIITSAPSATATGRAGTNGASGTHTHSVSVTGISTQSLLPPFINTVFAKRHAGITVYTQSTYQWYANANAEPPTDPWPLGGNDLDENTAISSIYALKNADVIRLRLAVGVANATSTAGVDAFKLQFATTTVACSAGANWFDVGSTSSSTAAWRGYDNVGVSNGATLTATTTSVATVKESYVEQNNSPTVPNDIGPNGYGEWDWVLQQNGAAAGTQYCFRMVRSDGSALDTYTQYPQLVTDQAPNTFTLTAPFPNQKATSTTPLFEFSATDPEAEDLHYEIEVSTSSAFITTIIDTDSSSNPTAFNNVLTPSDKAPFNSGDLVSYAAATALTNGTTYWWRVRSKDPSGSNLWTDWSTGQSFTLDNTVTIDTWFQTTDPQFSTDALSGVQTTGSNSVNLITGSSTGTISGSPIFFSYAAIGNAWGSFSWNHSTTTGSIKYHVEYFTSTSSWALIPDTDLSGNGTGFTNGPVSLLGVSPSTYSEIRVRADLTNSGGSPTINDWTVQWGTRVSQPTQSALFDNEKTATTTPTFKFTTTDPQGDDLTYQIQWSTDSTFATSVSSSTSDAGSGWSDFTFSGDTQPFTSGNTIQFKVPVANALASSTTFWWRVRAKDPGGGNAYSDWSAIRSFTTDTTVQVSTWFQTTNEQFSTDSQFGVNSILNSMQVATSVSDVMLAYGEGTSLTPKYRLWNGSTWGSQQDALSIGSAPTFVIVRPHPSANTYALATMGANGNVYVQVYQNGAWGNKQLMTTTVGSLNMRGFDIAYEQSSGRLIAAYCDGDSNPSYRIFDGTSWSSATGITMASAVNCGWLKLASKPGSNEIILGELPTDGSAYQALVWNGATWGNSSGTFGSMDETPHEGMSVQYEASGNQALFTVATGKNNNMTYKTWNGSVWSGAATLNVNALEWANLESNVGTDDMGFCYINDHTQSQVARWNGSAWIAAVTMTTTADTKADRPIDCAYETKAGRVNDLMAIYSDTTGARYQYWNGTSWSGQANISTIAQSSVVQAARDGQGTILGLFFNVSNNRYDFSSWDGSSWAAFQTLESSPSVSASPYKEPFYMAARNSATAGTAFSSSITFSDGLGPKWSSVSWNDSQTGGSSIKYHVQYFTSTSSWALIPDSDLSGNAAGVTTGPIDISGLNTNTYGTLRLFAELACSGGNCPTLNDWTVQWSQGITISGTAQQFNRSTNVTSGTVAVAVNGTLQSGKTATISGSGTWSISNVTVFSGDVVTVFVTGASANNRAVTITKYASGDITGLPLYERHLTLVSTQGMTNADISQYDNSVSGSGDLFYDVSGGALSVCTSVSAGCSNSRLFITSGTVYEPGGSVTTPNIEIGGTLIADANTISVSRSWKNTGAFIKGTSSVIFTATSTSETIDSSTATSSSFHVLTFGQGSGSASWSLSSPLSASSTMSISFGTLAPGAASTIMLDGDLSIGANGVFTKSAATTTFAGSGTSIWTDSSAAKQDLGLVVVDGSSKTIQLGSSVRATDVTIGADDTLDAVGAFTISIGGNWTNTNIFLARSSTVNFTANTTGHTITTGGQSFNNLTFSGSGGNWAFFESTLSIAGDLTISAGTLTLPTGTTTVAGTFNASGGTFMHNNGTVLLTASGAKSVTAGGSSFYNLTFNSSGSYSFGDTNATSSQNVIVTSGTITLPSGTLAVGGSLANNGGSITNNNGTLRFFAGSSQNIKLGGSSAGTILLDNASGVWTFVDTNATTTGDFSIVNGSTTLPTATLSVGGSFTNAGTFSALSGTVKLAASATGKSVNAGSSKFYNLVFNNAGGGYTISANATSTHDTTLANVANFTLASGKSLEVDGTFTNQVKNASTTWTGSTLYLNSGTSYAINTKANDGDTYAALLLGSATKIRSWNSSATTITTIGSASLYSQNNAAVSGALNIYGTFASGVPEYWSYATDFDGTALGGSSRAANVHVANGASVTLSGGLSIVGTSTATTTIANQGSGSFALSIAGGTTTAQYYQLTNTDANGLSISGTTTVSSLANGDYTLSANGGTSITVASTVIDHNPAMQIQADSFATSTGVSSGSNVTETGTPSSYWWFRNSFGPYDGEAFDNDPGGNPGYIRWDDSGFNITVSGHVYSDHGSTAIGNPPCDGSTAVVTVVVGTSTTYTGSCASGTGAYSISGVQFVGDVDLTVYLNTNGGKRAVTVTKTPTADINDLDLYQNAVVVRHENTSPITIADLASYDATKDSDIPFTAATGSPDTLTVKPNTELYVWGGKTFAPGGSVTLIGAGAGSAADGRLYLAANSTLTEAGTQSLSLGGGLTVSSGATFTPANSVVTFTATSTGKSITAAQALTLYDVTFNGAGGGYSLDSGSGVATTTAHSITFTAGTISGTGDLVVQSGSLAGGGTFTMTGGTVRLEGTGNFGNSNAWKFKNLTLGSGSAATTTATGSATTTVSGILTVATNETLQAGSAAWVLSGSGTPFVISGTFTAQTAPFSYTGTAVTTVANANYAGLTLAPSGAGSPTYTLSGGTPTIGSLTIGDGTNGVSVTANTNDPSIALSGSLLINTGATFIASNVGALNVGGSWINSGTFTHSNGSVLFNATATGNTIMAGASPFYDVQFSSSSGGWTISGSATSSHNTTLTAASSFTVASGSSLEVDGTFTNAVGGSATVWTGSTLYLNSGTSYSLNAKTDTGDTYGTLILGAASAIRAWNSSAATTTVASSASLYSQNHAGVSGDLYIWGAYSRSSGSDYWSDATDFDGTDISTTSPRQVNVRIASSSSVSISGGVLDIIGAATASTTIAVQGSGAYSLALSGGTLDAKYYQIRNTDANGLNISGSPTIVELGNGDYQLAAEGGTMLKVAGSVITANPLKVFKNDSFATSTGIVSGSNVTATGSSGSSWKFNLSYGNYQGEAHDNDPLGDPGYIVWDDSAAQITISGHVYSDEGTTVSSVCDGSTAVVRFKLEGAGTSAVSCAASDGAFSIPNISYNPGDRMILYLDTNGGAKGAVVSVDPVSSISDMDIYEHRVIVRHESATPLTIADMALYDNTKDSDIPFTATTSPSTTLTLPPNTKLIVWNNKTFAPAGNVTLQSGGSGTSYDGTLEVRNGATFSAASTQAHSIGGDFLIDSGGTFSPANSTVTFTATTTGHTITPSTSSFYNVIFNGTGGNWAFGQANATSTNDYTITNGTVALPTGTLVVGGSFINAGTFMHNNGSVKLIATASGKTIQASSSSFYNLTANGSGGAWTFSGSIATSSNDFKILAGTVTLPSSTFVVGGSFINSGGSFTSGSTVKLTAVASGKSIQAGGSNFSNLTLNGSGGEWTFLDSIATTTGSFTITIGSTTLPYAGLAIGGSLSNAGTFNAGTSTVSFFATSTGKTIDPGVSKFYNLLFNSSSGGWTISTSATSTASTTIAAASSFTLSSGKSLEVDGTFTNSVGGAATTFTGSTLYLNSGTSYALNAKANTGATYGTILLGTNTAVRMWKSSATTVTTKSGASLYSQNNANVSGDLYIYGAYANSTGTDYWSYATDFDGTALGGASRAVNVKIASSSSITYSGGTLNIVGTATASTSIANQGAGAYAFAVSGGTLNAQYYQVRNTDASGLSLSGTPTITSLANGDFQLSAQGGTMITLAATALDANASKSISAVSFATSTGITSGFNVTLTGSPLSAWTFTGSYGNYAGEAFDSDGATACGNIRWDDSSCLLISESHYRWRNDDGGEGALASAWYNVSWSNRKKVAVANANATSYTNIPVKIQVPFATGMNSDFSDLRFTDSSGTTSIPYWIESSTASATSTVWVQVPSLPASGSATIYMYYGNAGASDASNAASTFSFFESFESGSLASYSGDTSIFNIGATFAKNGTKGLDAGANTGSKTTSGIYQTSAETAQGKTIRFFQYVDASQQDEPCTYFGVGGSGSNYAVCLDEFPSQAIEIAKNVTSNDGSGTVLSSTAVSYTTGWYEVSINWLTNNSINVTVYDASGNVFATLSASDSAHTSGGVGFGYWGQHGGWDYYTVRPYTATAPTYQFGSAQASGGATWAAAEDTPITGVAPNVNLRARFSVQNTGANRTSQHFRLQVAPLGNSLNCESVPYVNYNDVPTTSGGCGSAVACMTTSSQFADQSNTSPSLTYPTSMAFTAGTIMEDPSNQTNALSVPSNTATEVEYNFQLTTHATGNAYCFRTTDGGLDLDNYNKVAEAVVNHPPQISNIALNNAADIALTEGTTTSVSASCTVTDLNGYADIVQATSSIYRSALGAACTADNNNCYQVATSSCTFSGCSGNSCTLTCTAPIQYFADPTDASSTFSAQSWLGTIAVQDSTGLRDTQSSLGVDLLTLYGLSIETGGINFGSLTVGQNTGAVDATTTIRNTGNSQIDVQLAGTDLSSGSNVVPVGEQKYATSTFVYGSCSICQFLTGSATNVDMNLTKPTSTSSASHGDLYFGIDVPNGTAATTFSGTNTFIAVGG